MDVAQPTEGMDVDSGDQTKTTEKNAVTEASQKIGESGFGSRNRKKSKYLSYPYTTSRPRHKDLPAQPEEVKRFRRNWNRKFLSHSRISSSPEFIHMSPKELLSGLQSKAVDCMFPAENKSFELVEWFFSRYRISTYHDEAELATSLADEKGGKTVKRVSSNKSVKKRKNNKMENAVKCKAKSLSGLSDMNVSISIGNTLRPGRKLEQKRKVEELSSSPQLQNVEINLNESSSKDNSVTEAPKTLSFHNSKEKARPRKRVKIKAAQNPQIASVYTHAKGTKFSSLEIDLRPSPPRPGVTPEESNVESKEEFVLKGSTTELCVPHEGLAENTANYSLLASTASEVGTVSQEGPIGNISGHNFFVNPASEGGTISQEGLVGNITNHRLLGSTTSEVRSGQSRSLSVCSRPFKTFNNDRVKSNGESPTGTFLLLQFAPGAYIPSKDELLTTFCQFGPLKASESQLFKGTGTAQIVFVRSTDAGEAFHNLEKNKPFGTTLVDYKLHHLPATCPSVEQLVTPTQPTRPMPKPVPVPVPMPLPLPGEAPPPSLEFIKQNLQMMTSVLENSGNNLSPQMNAKLDTEIKNLLRKVNAKAKSKP